MALWINRSRQPVCIPSLSPCVVPVSLSLTPRFIFRGIITTQARCPTVYTKKFKKNCSIFTARRYASAVYAMALCPSVCPSVRHKPVLYQMAKHRITQKRRRIAKNSSFLASQISLKFACDRPQQRRQTQVGEFKIVDFRPISRYISEALQDRNIVTIYRRLIGTRMCLVLYRLVLFLVISTVP